MWESGVQDQINFGQLFKYFRLKSEFKTISQFSNQLAEKNICLCDSLLYHWQSGNRVPTNRKLIISIIEVFIENKGIKDLDQANLFLKLANKGYLTDSEREQLPKIKHSPNQDKDKFKTEIQQFINNLNRGVKSDLEKIVKLKNKKIKFNFCISEDNYNYFSKIANNKKMSKANFLRKLITDYKNLHS